MFDSSRPTNCMSAAPNGFASRPALPRRRTLALTATLLLPASLPAFAAVRHAAATHTAATAHTTPAKHVSAPAHAPVKGHAVAARRPEGRETRHPETAQAALAAKAAKAVAARREEARLEKSRPASHHAAPAVHTAPTRQNTIQLAAKPAETLAEYAADHATEDRVHAWYRANHAAASLPDASATASEETDADASVTPTPVKPVHQASSQPDLSPVPHKATVADFDRAVQQQTRVQRAAVESQSHASTADDDAAEAESQIPSTAPTARVALPFTHGDLLTNAAANTGTPVNPTDVTASAQPVAKAPSPASPIAQINLQKPAPIVRAAAPVSIAVADAARKPKLDPEVVDGMTDETFSGDDTPTQSAKAAVVLAAKTAKADPVAKPIARVTDADDDTLAGNPTAVKVNLYDDRGRMVLIPPMKGTHEILVHQNQMAVSDGLDRIEDDDQLLDMRRLRLLVALPDNEAVAVDDRLPANRRYARPWSVRFLNDLGRAHYARFHSPLIITSAARTVAFQRRLILTNGNAAPPTGEVASPHLYGQAVDIAKHGMSVTEIAWMRAYLTPVESEGKIDVEEEFQQSCFHVSVYRRYLGLPSRKNAPVPEPAARPQLQQVKAAPVKRHHIPTALLATGLR